MKELACKCHGNSPGDFSAKFILIPIFGPILLVTKVALLFWFKKFSFIIILVKFQAVLSDFSRCFKCILNIFENQQKIKKIHKFYFFYFFPKFFFIIIIWNYFWIDSPEILILTVVVELVEWKVLRQKLLSRHYTVPIQKFLSQHFSFHKFNHHS